MEIKPLVLFAFLLITSSSVFGQAEKLLGTWLTDDHKTKIEFFKSGSTYSGRIVWLEQPNDTKGFPLEDRKNPELGKRKQKIQWLTIITGLIYKNNEFVSGTIYAPRRGEYAKCSIKVQSNNQLSITVKSGIFSDTKIWTKK
jgi:hypothetical protein